MASAMALPLVPALTHLTRGAEINSLMPNKCSISTLSVPKFAGLKIRCARVGGVEIPNNKRIEYSLQYIHGIGRTTARQVLYDLGMENKVTRELNENDLTRVRDEVSKYMIEGDLFRSGSHFGLRRFDDRSNSDNIEPYTCLESAADPAINLHWNCVARGNASSTDCSALVNQGMNMSTKREVMKRAPYDKGSSDAAAPEWSS